MSRSGTVEDADDMNLEKTLRPRNLEQGKKPDERRPDIAEDRNKKLGALG